MLPWLGLRIYLAVNGSSSRFLDAIHAFLQRPWLLGRTPVHGDPLRWKERHVEGVAPLAVLRVLPRWLGVLLVVLATTTSCLMLLNDHLAVGDTPSKVIQLALAGDLGGLRAVQVAMDRCDWAFFVQGIIVMLLAALVIGVRCSGAVTGEREKNTWEALLLTPLETRQLIRSKLWGILGASWPYLVAYALPALTCSLAGGVVPVLMTLLALGVTLLALFFVGSAGLWCSVRSKTSWRSLLSTLGISYIGGFILFCILFVPGCILGCIIMLFLLLIEEVVLKPLGLPRAFTAGGMAGFGPLYNGTSIALSLLMAVCFVGIAWWFLRQAEYQVSVLERTKHWRNEPRHPRWSSHARERRAAELDS
jgi:ABC-type transport system involved in multi-copper enzyme maturation permease subunit